eukprot:357809-Chlamydomonas_euryale.AAC.1
MLKRASLGFCPSNAGRMGPQSTAPGCHVITGCSPVALHVKCASRGLRATRIGNVCWYGALRPIDGVKTTRTLSLDRGSSTPSHGSMRKLPQSLALAASTGFFSPHSAGTSRGLLSCSVTTRACPVRTHPKSSVSALSMTSGVCTSARNTNSSGGPSFTSTGSRSSIGPVGTLGLAACSVNATSTQPCCGAPGSFCSASGSALRPHDSSTALSKRSVTAAPPALVSLNARRRAVPVDTHPKSTTYVAATSAGKRGWIGPFLRGSGAAAAAAAFFLVGAAAALDWAVLLNWAPSAEGVTPAWRDSSAGWAASVPSAGVAPLASAAAAASSARAAAATAAASRMRASRSATSRRRSASNSSRCSGPMSGGAGVPRAPPFPAAVLPAVVFPAPDFPVADLPPTLGAAVLRLDGDTASCRPCGTPLLPPVAAACICSASCVSVAERTACSAASNSASRSRGRLAHTHGYMPSIVTDTATGSKCATSTRTISCSFSGTTGLRRSLTASFWPGATTPARGVGSTMPLRDNPSVLTRKSNGTLPWLHAAVKDRRLDRVADAVGLARHANRVRWPTLHLAHGGRGRLGRGVGEEGERHDLGLTRRKQPLDRQNIKQLVGARLGGDRALQAEAGHGVGVVVHAVGIPRPAVHHRHRACVGHSHGHAARGVAEARPKVDMRRLKRQVGEVAAAEQVDRVALRVVAVVDAQLLFELGAAQVGL